MTHEETSMQTKRMLCASLKKIMKTKPFSKITVSELIKDCNLNRKTFYYHFEDIYGLLRWMLEQEAFEVVKQFDLLLDYTEEKIGVQVEDSFRHFLCDFYTEALAGMLINLFQRRNGCDRDRVLDYFSVILMQSLPGVLRAKAVR